MDKKVGNQKRKYLIKKETNAIKLKYIELTQSTINYQVKNSSIDRNIESKDRKRERERERKIIRKKGGELEGEGEKKKGQFRLSYGQACPAGLGNMYSQGPTGLEPPAMARIIEEKNQK